MINIDFKQAKEILDLFGGEPCGVTLIEVSKEEREKWHSGEGLYAIYEACPEEGAVFLGKYDEEAKP